MICPVCGVEDATNHDVCSACGADRGLSSSPTDAAGQMQPLDTTFAPGAAFADRFTIVERVGQGGMGQVYKAIDTHLGKPVALKLVRAGTPEARGLERFRRELSMARQVSHNNVCRVHDIGESEGIHFISMEFVEGQTLQEWTRAVGKLSTPQAISVARQVCDGLAAIHATSIVHRDLKPSNIMLDKSGRAVIMDFGLAYQPASEQITAEGEVLGTLAYLSPEQACGGKGLDHRSDIYALGLVIFEMLTGARPPADGNSLPMGLRDRTQRCRPPSALVPEIPGPLDGIVLRCIEHNKSKRYRSADDIDDALRQVQDDLDSHPRLTPLPVSPRRGVWKSLAALAAILIVAAVVLYQVLPSPPDGPTTVAVLPLAYEGAPATAYLANALPVVLIKNLVTTDGIEAAPFESSRLFPPGEDPLSVARQLGVDWVIVGALSVDEGNYEITLTLWSTNEPDEVWSGGFEGLVADHTEAARVAADQIATTLGRRGPATPAAGRDPATMAAYAEGLLFLEGWDVDQNTESAVAAFRRALDVDERFAEAHAGLARALYLQFRDTSTPALFDQALREANRAVELAPALPEAQLAHGTILLGQGRSTEAAAAFERALEMAPADDAVCRRIGDVYLDLGRTDEAAEFYRLAIDLRPTFWENYNKMGLFHLGNGEFSQAAEHFNEVMILRPASEIGYTNLGATYIYEGRFEEARPLFETAIEIEPTGIAYNNLGFVHYSMHEFDNAASAFGSATKLAPDDPYGWVGLGDALRQLERDQEARQNYLRAIDLFRDALLINAGASETEALMATAQAGLNRCAEATESAVAATSADDSNFAAHYYAAVAYATCGDYDAAEHHTLRAMAGGYEVDVRTNPDLAPLLERPAIRELLR